MIGWRARLGFRVPPGEPPDEADMIEPAAHGVALHLHRMRAEAIFRTGTGMPTLPDLEALEHDLGKAVISCGSAMMWHALRSAGVRQPIPGYGRLLTLE